jgi:hypothetical protein
MTDFCWECLRLKARRRLRHARREHARWCRESMFGLAITVWGLTLVFFGALAGILTIVMGPAQW